MRVCAYLLKCIVKITNVKINPPLLHKLGRQAHLEVDVRHEAALLADLEKVLSWFEKLQELDTAGIHPLATMASAPSVGWDEDTPQPPLAHEALLANAPGRTSNYFSVPQVKD